MPTTSRRHPRALVALTALTAWIAGAAFLPVTAHAQNKSQTWLSTNFMARSHVITGGTMYYRLYKPVGYDSTKKYPIVVALHGIGERGNNNTAQIYNEELPQPWVRDSVQAKYPHFVMVPQCPSNVLWWPSNTWDGARSNPNIGIISILDSLKKEFSLDTTRFYVVGLSMGGFGTIELMKWNPNLFAAAVPTAGGGDTAAATIPQYVKTPAWFFHSATDPTVNVDRGSRTLVTKMEANLGRKFVRFTSDTGMTNPVAFSGSFAVVTKDSLYKAVYVDKANFLYSEVRNVPGSGNTLHQAGWFAAWRHPMLTDWVFSKRKVAGVTAIAPTVASRAFAPANVKIVMRGGVPLLEKALPGGTTRLYTLEGKVFEVEGVDQ
jgi:predicted peptidase